MNEKNETAKKTKTCTFCKFFYNGKKNIICRAGEKKEYLDEIKKDCEKGEKK